MAPRTKTPAPVVMGNRHQRRKAGAHRRSLQRQERRNTEAFIREANRQLRFLEESPK